MAYDEFMADRIRLAFREKKVEFEEKKMMGGLCFMVDDKMCCGILFDKKKDTDLLMARIGEPGVNQAMQMTGCQPMDFTGRPMKGFVFVTPEGYDTEEDLEYWLQLCLDYNPQANSSKKKIKSMAEK
jgi:hypothetical protein